MQEAAFHFKSGSSSGVIARFPIQAAPSRPLKSPASASLRREREGGEVKADLRVTVPLAPGSEGGETRLKDGPGMNIKKKH